MGRFRMEHLPERVSGDRVEPRSGLPQWLTRGLAAMVLALMVSASAVAQPVLPPGLGTPGGGTRVPRQGYDVVLAALAEGNLSTALDVAAKENRGGMRSGSQRWIDSIATSALLGECFYELGRYTDAVAAYDEALLLSAEHANWMLSVRFSSQPLKAMPRPIETPWAESTRNVPAAQMPSAATIRQGTVDAKEVLEKGGVLAAPVDYPIRPQEIMRSTVLALYRRHSILGDLSDVGPVLENAKRALAARPAPPNHYSQSWIDIALGTANWAQGRLDQAVPIIRRGLLAENQFDHPLTCWGLIVLGRIALDSDEAATASVFFSEATISATQFQDIRALEEAFRWAVTAHLAAGGQGVPAGIPRAVEWAGRKLPALQARLLAMQAELYAANGDSRRAVASLRDIDPRILRGDLGKGAVGAQSAYAEALAAYLDGRVARGDTELQKAIELIRPHCPRLLQVSRTMGIIGEGSSLLSDRQADLLFEKLLADPIASDYAVDPLGTLAFLSTPKPNAFASWFAVAARRSDEEALAASEAGRRAHWLSTQFLGGRQLAIRRLLELDPAMLPADDAPRRAALLARSPDLGRLLDETLQARAPLSAAINGVVGQAAVAAAGSLPGDLDDWQLYAQLSQQQSAAIATISASRNDTPLAFPPLYDVQEIRSRLRPGVLLLSFHQNPGGLAGALEGHERMTTWQITDLAGLSTAVTDLMRGMAVYDFNNVVGTDRFAETSCRDAAQRLERILFENARIDLSRDVEELVIVPDGLLWYVPFELLPVGSDVAARPAGGAGGGADAGMRPLLRDACRVRYAPTRSLAVEYGPPLRRGGVVGVHAGHLYRGDRAEVVAAAANEITAAMEKALLLGGGPGGRDEVPLPLPASLVDALVVLDELPPTSTASGAAMIPSEGSQRVMAFDEWLAPPRKRPGLLVLAGFQSAAAAVNTPSKLPPRPGDELFEASMTALAAGARTAVISRWRTGGFTTAELMREFVRDCLGPGDGSGGPAESWRRAVDLVTPEPLHLPYEPRVKLVGNSVLEDASHPFFWAGYMLVDTGTMPAAEDADPAARPAMQMQAGGNGGAAMRAEGAGPAANAAGPAGTPPASEPPPRTPVSQAFNPLLDAPPDATRE